MIPGTDWTLLGPNAYYDVERINDSRRYCRELQDDIGEPFAFLNTYDIGGRFCLVNRRLPPIGPYCQGNTCYQENTTAICDANQGETNGPFMCTLPPDTYRRAEGPLMWNGEMLQSSAAECDGFFCAIPEPNVGENLRCPGSPIGLKSSNGSPGQPTPGEKPSAATVPSSSHLAVLVLLLGLTALKLW